MNKREKLIEFMENIQDKEKLLISILYEAQKIYGCISQETEDFISQYTGISIEKIDKMIEFYRVFKRESKAIYNIKICMGNRCQNKNAEKLKKEIENYLNESCFDEGEIVFEEVQCLGACCMAPMVVINNKAYDKITIEKFRELVEKVGR